jgi:acetyl-CoA synthetase
MIGDVTTFEFERSDVADRFEWDMARRWLAGQPGGGVNIACEAVDRHVVAGRGGVVALRFLRADGSRAEMTYSSLAEETSRFANALLALGVVPGDHVFTLCGRIPELYVAVLGALKAKCVVSPLFSAFGPDPIRQRMAIGDGRVLVTTSELYERKVAPIRGELPGLRHVLVADGADGEGVCALAPLMKAASDHFTVDPTSPDDVALLHFTSGTTGAPKGAVHVHGAVVAHHATGRMVLGLRDGDVYWCTADPGWVTGMSYGIVAPLTCGITSIVDEAEFDAHRWYATLADERVDVWYTAPTAIRMLMKAGDDAPAFADLSHLRFAASVGEPLSAEAVEWGARVLGQPFHDNWWQTETGGIMVANTAALPIRPGSMGQPVPGVTATVLAVDDEGAPRLDEQGHVIESKPDAAADALGMLALRAGWPSMFRAYLGQPERYERCFADGWYLSGDLVRRDADGYYWFVARADDVIKSAGHLIGPFEVEAALMQHRAVAEAAVYGVPDAIAGAVVHAAVVLRPGFEFADVERDVLAHARRRLGPAVAPRVIRQVGDLPKTRSGKVLRRLLRARELGLPEGDLSTIETTTVTGS